MISCSKLCYNANLIIFFLSQIYSPLSKIPVFKVNRISKIHKNGQILVKNGDISSSKQIL